MPNYQVTIKYDYNTVMRDIREYPSPDIEAAFKYFEEEAREELGTSEIETITVECMPLTDHSD